jgi:hypothetical protein
MGSHSQMSSTAGHSWRQHTVLPPGCVKQHPASLAVRWSSSKPLPQAQQMYSFESGAVAMAVGREPNLAGSSRVPSSKTVLH